MRLLITLPVYNETQVLDASVRAVHTYCNAHLKNFDWTILIADNGSTDGTLALAEQIAAHLPRVTVFHTNEKGRGQALRRAWMAHDALIYAYMDVDLAVDLAALEPLVECIQNNQADIAIGSRLIPGAYVNRSNFREITSRVYNTLVKYILNLSIRDTQCGFKAISKHAATILLPLTEDGNWFWDTELLGLAHAQGFRTKEIPVSWVETRTVGRKSKVAVFRTSLDYINKLLKLRKKIVTLQGVGSRE